MKILIGTLRQLIRENINSVRLYRGMLQSDLEQLEHVGFHPTRHSGNVASTDVLTSLYWAGQRGSEDDPGVVIQFDAPVDAVVEDDLFKGDYRFVAAFMPKNVLVIRDGIIEPIRESVM